MRLNILHILIGELKNDTRVLSEINLAADKGHVITAVCYRQSDINCGAQRFISISSKHSGRYKVLFGIFALVRAFVCGLWYCLFKQRMDVIHCHDVLGLIIGSLIKLSVFWHKSKIVYDTHELAWDTYHLQDRPIRRAIFVFLERLFIRFADKVVVVTPKIAELYEKRYHLKDTPSVYYNLFHDLAPKQKLPQFSKKLVYVGGLVQGKGLEKILRLPTDTIQKLDLTIIGKGPLKNVFLELSKSFPNIKVEGYIDPSDVVNRLTEFDYGILPLVDADFGQSKFLAMPNKLFEYASAGLGLIAWKGEAQRIAIEEYDLGFYPEEDELFEDYIRRIILSDSGSVIDYSAFRKTYSLGQNQARLLSVYLEDVNEI